MTSQRPPSPNFNTVWARASVYEFRVRHKYSSQNRSFFLEVFFFLSFFFNYLWNCLLLNITLSGTTLNISHWFFLILSGTLGAAHYSFISLLGLFFFPFLFFSPNCLSPDSQPFYLTISTLNFSLTAKILWVFVFVFLLVSVKDVFPLGDQPHQGPIVSILPPPRSPSHFDPNSAVPFTCPSVLSNPQQKNACWKEETRLVVSLHYHFAATISMSLKLPLPVSQNHWICNILKTSKRWLSSTGN